mgnify:CR=1 FL=1
MLEGLIQMPWWGYVVTTLAATHITIIAVTVYLHRHQAHRALDLHPAVAHFFRFWLWIGTGMTTKAWVAIHRKHHAKCETPDDPHSPIVLGIRKVFWQGAELYRAEAKKNDTLDKYGHNTPNDWIERNLYSRYSGAGLIVMLILDIILFGPIGITMWAVQMLWIPVTAAGIINGIGHYWGYRNYECADAARNILPWGILIGGEELHNNHHTFASSAKLSSKWWEFDIGWMYIRILAFFGLAHVKKVAPKPTYDPAKRVIDIETVKAVIANRFQIMARFARDVVHQVHREELQRLDPTDKTQWVRFKRARKFIVREPKLIAEPHRESLNAALAHSGNLRTVYTMKEKLQQIWQQSAATQEQLRHALEEWCRQAEATGIQALRDFASKLPTYSLATSR